jgi:hypothetical protein
LRREFLRRRFLKAISLGPRPCSTTSAVTLAPDSSGLPSLGSPDAGQHQHLGELDRGARIAGDLLDGHDVFGRHTILLAAGLDDSVHG